jgi:hypothetical protein
LIQVLEWGPHRVWSQRATRTLRKLVHIYMYGQSSNTSPRLKVQAEWILVQYRSKIGDRVKNHMYMMVPCFGHLTSKCVPGNLRIIDVGKSRLGSQGMFLSGGTNDEWQHLIKQEVVGQIPAYLNPNVGGYNQHPCTKMSVLVFCPSTSEIVPVILINTIDQERLSRPSYIPVSRKAVSFTMST